MDVQLTRLVVVCLATVCCLCVLGTVALQALGHEPSAALVALATMCAGVLCGIPITTRAASPENPPR